MRTHREEANVWTHHCNRNTSFFFSVMRLTKLTCVTKRIQLIWKRIPRSIFILYAVTFFILLPHICFTWRFSLITFRVRDEDSERKRLWAENKQRQITSQRIIDNISKNVGNPSQSGPLIHSENVDVAIVLVTLNRNKIADTNPQYLTQTVGRLLYLLQNKSRQAKRKYGIFLCNVDIDANQYEEIKTLKNLLPVYQRFANVQEPASDRFKKEKEDYIFCLDETLKRNVTYMLLLEDDAYAHEDLLPVMEAHLDNIEKRSPTLKKTTFVKFYHPERSLGYINPEWERLPELVSVSLTFGTILFVFFANRALDRMLVWCACVVYCCLVTLVIGRVNLMELRRVSVQTYQVTPSAPDCMVAMLYTRYGAEFVASSFKNVTCTFGYAKDSALNDIRRNNSLRALQVQPNLFKHIGLVSSVRQRIIDPFIV